MYKVPLKLAAVLLLSATVCANAADKPHAATPPPPDTSGAERPHKHDKGGKPGDKTAKPGEKPVAPKPGAKPGEGEVRPYKELLEKLNLTDDQKPKIRAIMDKHFGEWEKYRETHKDEFLAVREKLEAARKANDEAALKAARQEMFKLYSAGPTHKALGEKIRPILAADQQKIFDAEIEKVKQRAKEWMDNNAKAKSQK